MLKYNNLQMSITKASIRKNSPIQIFNDFLHKSAGMSVNMRLLMFVVNCCKPTLKMF